MPLARIAANQSNSIIALPPSKHFMPRSYLSHPPLLQLLDTDKIRKPPLAKHWRDDKFFDSSRPWQYIF